MKRSIRRRLFAALVCRACAVLSCADRRRQSAGAEPGRLARSNAMGGAERLAAIKTIPVKGERQAVGARAVRRAGRRHALRQRGARSRSSRTSAARASRTDWVKNFAYPAPRTFTYSEIVTPEAGYVLGVDSNGRNAQNLKMTPPAHSMSGYRLATSQREGAPRLAHQPAARRCRRARTRCSRRPTSDRRSPGGVVRRLHRRLRPGDRPAVARAHARLRQRLGRRDLRPGALRLARRSAA